MGARIPCPARIVDAGDPFPTVQQSVSFWHHARAPDLAEPASQNRRPTAHGFHTPGSAPPSANILTNVGGTPNRYENDDVCSISRVDNFMLSKVVNVLASVHIRSHASRTIHWEVISASRAHLHADAFIMVPK